MDEGDGCALLFLLGIAGMFVWLSTCDSEETKQEPPQEQQEQQLPDDKLTRQKFNTENVYEVCYDGVTYIVTTGTVSPKYTREGKVAVCDIEGERKDGTSEGSVY